MKEITILIPKLKPPFVIDTINFQMENVVNALKKIYTVKVIWVVFPPNEIQEVKEPFYEIVDYHNYKNALEILNEFNPNLVLMEGILGITGITFSETAKFKKIPVATLFPPSIVNSNKSIPEVKRKINLIFSHNILGYSYKHSSNKNFGMLKYFLKRYFFLLKTLRSIGYDLFDIFKFILFYPTSHIFSTQIESIHPICSGDLNFVLTDSHKQYLIELGYEPKTIHISGESSFDHLFSHVQKNTENPLQDKNNFKILFCTSPMHEHSAWTKKQEDSLILNTINEISKSSNFQISIKIHPTSSIKEEYIQLLSTISHDVPLYQKENLLELIKTHDLMIVYGSSTVVLYGILLKKSIVMLNLKGYPSQYNLLFDKNVMSICENISELIPILRNSLSQKISDQAYQIYLKKELGIDGKASEKIANDICDLLKNNST